VATLILGDRLSKTDAPGRTNEVGVSLATGRLGVEGITKQRILKRKHRKVTVNTAVSRLSKIKSRDFPLEIPAFYEFGAVEKT